MSWAHYLLQVNFYLVIFYGFYKLLLDRETYFILNRFYLLLAGGLSLSIPFLRFEWFVTHPVAQPLYTRVDQLNDLVAHVSIMQDTPESFNLGNVIVFIYISGILFFSLKFIYKLYKVKTWLKKVESGNAYTFFNRKVIDQKLPHVMVIDKHEEIHIRQLHTLDIIFFELVNIFTWFNPIIYLYKNTIKNIHEYLADEEAAKFQGDKEAYALLLLSSALGVSPSNLMSSFLDKSLLKKRVFMLHKQRSRRVAILKYGLFLPIFALTLILSSATIRKNEKLLAVAEEITLNTPFAATDKAINDPIESIISAHKTAIRRDSTAKVTQNWDQFYTYIKKSIRYPENALKKELQGNTLISFKVKNGQLSHIGILKKLGEDCDEKVIELIKSYKDFHSIQDGQYSVNVGFRINGSRTVVKNTEQHKPTGYTQLNDIITSVYAPAQSVASNNIQESKGEETTEPKKEENPDKVYDFVSIYAQPSFPGGMDKFYSYLKKTIKYPQVAEKNNIEGKVYLSFTVEKDGALTDIKVDRKLGSGTDEEAIRVLADSPKWIPGINNGAPVRVKYNIQIGFSLGKDHTPKGPQKA